MPQRLGRSIWAFVGFLALSYFLLAMLTKVYLLRTWKISNQPMKPEKN